MKNLESVLAKMESVGLKGLDSVALMRRVDSKYIFNLRDLPPILEQVMQDYVVLEINGIRLFQYDSVYLDSEDFKFYFAHHNGKPNRTKIRYRHYVDTGGIYFEVKKKVKGSRTDKFRVKVPAISAKLDVAATELMRKLELPTEGLELKQWVCYKRITLASPALSERVTLDLGLVLRDDNSEQVFEDLVIAEVKQGNRTRTSPMAMALRSKGIRECRLSKYTLAVAKLAQPIKANGFKEKILKLQKIIGE